MLYRGSVLVMVVCVVACTTSPLGRTQLKFFPPGEVVAMGAAAFDKIKAETPQSRDPRLNRYVRCVTQALTAELPGHRGQPDWEVVLFAEDAANAFALPGGKIGVYTGMLRVAENQDQLATVIAHEIAHILAEHPNERLSTVYATQVGLQQLVRIVSGAPSPGQQQLLALLGVGAQVGVVLPFSRAQEREADLLGVELMARAGFDPRQSLQLWQRMSQAGGPRPPEFLSTHPSSETRMADLEARLPAVLPLYEQARAQGRRPQCS
ncbi:MAG: M48 family metallopeptidase [Thermodesulfobacteriota bacterium]|jgi:predicted Zn-dependent protease